jgi:serine phosphatase RsbU (regulator of sigma subunit)
VFRLSLTILLLLITSLSCFSQLDYGVRENQIKEYLKSNHYGSAKKEAQALIDDPDSPPGSFGHALGLYYLGQVQFKQLDFLNAIENSFASREMFMALDSNERALNANYTLFNIYLKEEEPDLAIDICKAGVDLSIEMKDTFQMARWYNSLGNSYVRKGEYENVIEVERKSLRYSKLINNTLYMSFALSTIGEAHYFLGDNDSALYYMDQSLELKLNGGFPASWLQAKIGKVYLAQNKPNEAIAVCQDGYNKSVDLSDVRHRKFCCECLHEAYSQTGSFGQAYKYLDELNTINAETESDAKKNDIVRLNFEIQYQQQAIADSVAHEKEKEITEATINLQKEKLSHEKSIRIYLFIGLGLVLLFAFIMVNRLQVIKRQKTKIAKQKEEADRLREESEQHRLIAEEKNVEILDSINYAKRIQSAILPPMSVFNELLTDSFVVYKPKDIVAGDFYWVRHERDRTFFAAADCTGHGVPGAMVSVICNNALNRSVSEFGLNDPGKILDKTREIITEELAKGENEVADGMDIALCCLVDNKAYFSGAHNPLWISRNGEMLVTKGDNQPVGKYFDPTPFSTHKVDLQDGDMIYLFSDGFQDQFGGEKGKKFKAKAFMKLLLEMKDKSMKEQSSLLSKAFDDWKGNFEQLDDVCVIGLRI